MITKEQLDKNIYHLAEMFTSSMLISSEQKQQMNKEIVNIANIVIDYIIEQINNSNENDSYKNNSNDNDPNINNPNRNGSNKNDSNNLEEYKQLFSKKYKYTIKEIINNLNPGLLDDMKNRYAKILHKYKEVTGNNVNNDLILTLIYHQCNDVPFITLRTIIKNAAINNIAADKLELFIYQNIAI